MKIGLRIPGACGKLPLDEFARWCKSDGFDAMDLGNADAARVAAVREAGLAVGTIDLPGTGLLLHPDASERSKGIETARAALNAVAAVGGDKVFCVFVPGFNPQQPRRESLENWKAAFPDVASEAEKVGVRIAVEGWPGPNNSALGVTPETLRVMFAAVPTPFFGINYDPSHLIRVGVDHKRFLDEFAARIIHAHGKDTALDAEGLYAYGNIGPSLDKAVAFGGGDWRYSIPGEGVADWPFITARLHRAGFDGIISLELEDFRYNGSEEGEKRGLSRARAYLAPLL